MRLRRARRGGRAPLAIRLGAVVVSAALLVGLALDGRATKPPGALQQVELAVDGLHCPLWCPIRIDRALDGSPGLFELEVDVGGSAVRVMIDPERTSARELAERLRARGWEAAAGRR